jgi:hypothetical protein
MDVIFAGPLHSHGFTGELLGKDRRFDDEIRLRFTAETATEQRDVEGDIVERQPRRSAMRSRVTCGAWLGAQASHTPLS